SHVAHALCAAGRQVIVLDDLSTGLAQRLSPDIPLVTASILDGAAVTGALGHYRIEGVIHLAAKKSVSESVANPGYYYEQNVVGLQRLLAAMQATGITRLVFSSSAAVYGGACGGAVDETCRTVPLSPYGWTKLTGEDLTRHAGDVGGLHWLALRYFNVVGAGSPALGDLTVANLIPMTFRALDQGRRPQIFGNDYATPDGSCIRDYVHVADVADAHVAAAARLEHPGAEVNAVYNVGRGVGVSVKEVLDAVRKITERAFEPEVVHRRPGDPPAVVAQATAIDRALGWRAQRDLPDMIRSSWASWRTMTPRGPGVAVHDHGHEQLRSPHQLA
ncbi:MAG: UDP-glucose 4-epimerase GalE, partial [Pseudonocardiaceae bacterium]